jgi:1-deoxy-D-xylulose-5-phosphate synthase
MILEQIDEPRDLRRLTYAELETLAAEIRAFIVDAVTKTGGHLGSNLGAVELTLALHRVFESPRDLILWDTGHQAYVHKLVTGRREGFARLRQANGLSGYPNRRESPHDWVENSHASTILSYAHGLATALAHGGQPAGADGSCDPRSRRIVAVVGDGALTGGMAYEALNNLGHSGRRVVIVLNDNGRSYAPTVSRLSESLTRLRLNPAYTAARGRIKDLLRELPAVGGLAYSSVLGLTSAIREVIEPHVFFEALGVRYTGPLDGHDMRAMETALANAAAWDGPIVVHVLTHKGRGYAPAEEDDVQCLHDLKVPAPLPAAPGAQASYTDAFSRALLRAAERDRRIVAVTAAMPGPTGLLSFQARYPDRFLDVGIAEQHAVTAAAGMALGGLRPVVAIYSTFMSRAFDQVNLDVGLHGLPVVLVMDRAGVTGDDGPSHHGLLDLAQMLLVPGMAVFAPSSAAEVEVMLETALGLPGPAAIRFPKTPSPVVGSDEVGHGLSARLVQPGDGRVCVLAVGKMVGIAAEAVEALRAEGLEPTLWDVRVVRPLDQEMLADAERHQIVVTVEDGVRVGGAGTFIADSLAARRPGSPWPLVRTLGLPTAYIPQAKPAEILKAHGLDAPGIADSIRRLLASVAEEARSNGTSGSESSAPYEEREPTGPVDLRH